MRTFVLNSLQFCLLLASSLLWVVEAQTDDEPITWAHRIESNNEVITTLQFYFHDKVSGQNPSVVRIAQAPQTNNSSTLFGMLVMIDDLLTIGPDPSSRAVGRARGMYGSAGQTGLDLIMVLNYGFTDGIYNGSSFSLLSINPAMQPVREMAIVGGTGLFRLGRGYALAHTHWIDVATGDAIVGYNVTIATYV
ncbi:Dirigent protein 23 [Striga hermonthica]|uniref:Dirigent protein n=1 Tax=Striga hermonthica TaxID=68872 RepID=A0A9N7R2F1_STRHE|nr:Dirigent protein 23 [Striga hermonthica]